jgi:hypothetical protein
VADSRDDGREPAPASYVETIRTRLRIGEMPPDRYVALEAHRRMVAGPLVHKYPDREVDAHVQRVYALLTDYDHIDVLRRQWLSSDEYERVQAEIERSDDPDYNY